MDVDDPLDKRSLSDSIGATKKILNFLHLILYQM